MLNPLSAKHVNTRPAFGGSVSYAAINNNSTTSSSADVFAPSAVTASTPAAPMPNRKQSVLLPAESVVVLVPGLGAPATTMQFLFDDFKSRGHKPYIVQVPQILSGKRLADGSAWLAGEIDTIRLREAKPRLEALVRQLSQANPAGRQTILKNHFGFDDSPQGQAAQSLTEQLLMDTAFTREVLGLAARPENAHLATPWLNSWVNQGLEKLSPEVRESITQFENRIESKLNEWRNKPPEQRLARVLEKYRTAFVTGLNQSNPGGNGLAQEKIANAVFDKLVPRVALVGHSMGGLVSYKTLQDTADQNNAIFANYCLSSPVDGLWSRLPYMQTPLEAIYPATGDLMANSPAMQQIRNATIPADTTAISLCNPADGTVKASATRLNEDKPGTLNLTVSPRKAGLLSLVDNRLQRLVNAIPPLQKVVHAVTDSWMMSDTSTHCGLLVDTNELWAPGAELDKRLLEDDDAPARLQRLLAPHNSEAVQRSVLQGLREHLENNPAGAERFASLKPQLMALAELNLPFEGSASQLAGELLVELSLPELSLPEPSLPEFQAMPVQA